MVFTGGSYAALALISSNIFGNKFYSGGLTQYELKQLTNIKICGTIILENVPQLIIQAIYAADNGITEAVAIAFIASSLSVTATLLGYLIDRGDGDTIAVQYYLSLKCERDIIDYNNNNDHHEEVDGGLTVKAHVSHKDFTNINMGEKIKSFETENGVKSNQLSDEERTSIIHNKGRTQALSESLADLYQIQPKNIEVGSTLVHRFGAIVHIVHMISKSEMEVMQQELNGNNININPRYFTEQLCLSLQSELNQLFQTHYGLSQEFMVEYSVSANVKRRTMTRGMIMDNENERRNMDISNRNLLDRIVTHEKLNIDGKSNNAHQFRAALTKFLDDDDDAFDAKLEGLVAMARKINDEKQEMIGLMDESKEDTEFNTGDDMMDAIDTKDVNVGVIAVTAEIEMVEMTSDDRDDDIDNSEGIDVKIGSGESVKNVDDTKIVYQE